MCPCECVVVSRLMKDDAWAGKPNRLHTKTHNSVIRTEQLNDMRPTRYPNRIEPCELLASEYVGSALNSLRPHYHVHATFKILSDVVFEIRLMACSERVSKRISTEIHFHHRIPAIQYNNNNSFGKCFTPAHDSSTSSIS